jgi:hypothetical protein
MSTENTPSLPQCYQSSAPLLAKKLAEAEARKGEFRYEDYEQMIAHAVRAESGLMGFPESAIDGDLGESLFVLNLVAPVFSSDRESMDAPYFALGNNDTHAYTWTSADGRCQVTVTPPQPNDLNARTIVPEPSRRASKSTLLARATIHDKDILIYLASCLVSQLKAGETFPEYCGVLLTPFDFFKALGKPCGGEAYIRLKEGLERLARTYIHRLTKKEDGTWAREQGFSLISSWDAIIDADDSARSNIKVVISEQLAESIKTRNVLRLHAEYFRLRKGLAKALYLVARAKCGKQPEWPIGLENLRQRVGSRDILRNFRKEIKEIIKENSIPAYELQLSGDDIVTFLPKVAQKRALRMRLPRK